MKKFILGVISLCLMFSISACSSSSSSLFGPKTIPVSNIILSADSVELTVGKSKSITYTILPEDATNRSLTWQSSDENVASVSYGQIKAISPGTATITVFNSEGVTARCVVKVIQKPAYDRLTESEKRFVDNFVKYADRYFINPSSVEIKNIFIRPSDYIIFLSAENQLGGTTSQYVALDYNEGFLNTKQNYNLPESTMNIELINKAIKEKM